MATWYSSAGLDGVLDHIKDNATQILLLDQYTAGENFATVTGNSIGSAAIGSSDFTGPTANGNNRRLTFDGKGGSATANSSVGQLHIAIVSGSEVLAVTDETTDQPITSGNDIAFGSFDMFSNQPTQV